MKKIALFLFITLLLMNCSSNDDSEPVADCGKANNLSSVNTSATSTVINWEIINFATANPTQWELEIGPSGFTPGNGTTFNTGNSGQYTFNNLSPSTNYHVYIKALCSNNTYGENVGPYAFTTDSTCATPTNLHLVSASSCSFLIDWHEEGNTSAWEIEFGESGFTLGSGTVINTSYSEYTIDEGIWPNTTYEVYVRANCGSQGKSNYIGPLVVTTDPLYFNSLPSDYFVGDYYIEDVSAIVGPANGTQNFESGFVNLQPSLTDPNARRFYVTIFPLFFPNTVREVGLKFDLNNMTVEMDFNINTSLTCNGGISTVNLANANSENSIHNFCSDQYIIVTYTEDSDASCGGPYTSSFSLTKL